MNKIHINKRIIFLCFYIIFYVSFSQRTSIGFFCGPSIGYNAIHSGPVNYHGLLDISFDSEESFRNTISMLNDDNLSNNIEAINGSVLGIRANFPITKGFSIQSELEYQALSFNHILYQNSENAIFNDLDFALSGLRNENQYKISNYLWMVQYINFPFVLKFYPSDNLFFQIGAKFGFLLKAAEIRSSAKFNQEDQTYIEYEFSLEDVVIYEFFDSTSGLDHHGFDKNEWPFNWNAAVLGGVGYETNTFYFSLRYTLGLLPFFKEIENKDDDFFENYNSEFDEDVYHHFEADTPLLNNNFKLHNIHFTIGCHLSN